MSMRMIDEEVHLDEEEEEEEEKKMQQEEDELNKRVNSNSRLINKRKGRKSMLSSSSKVDNEENIEESTSSKRLSMEIDFNDNKRTNFTSAKNSYTSPRHIGAAGSFRYLKPDEIESGKLPSYDFAVIVNRSVKMTSGGMSGLFKTCCCCLSWLSPSNIHNAERHGFRRLCMVNSPLLHESEDEHRRIVDKLCGQGLLVDIIDGGHSKEEMNSEYFILLIRASDEVVNAYVKRFRYHLWMDHGAIVDMEQDLISRNEPPTPAERVQVVDYIIEQRANISTHDPWIYDMFPMHDSKFTDQLISKWVTSCNFLEFNDKKFIKALRHNFGEKVAYYFAFINYYNRALIPIAILGVFLQLLHGILPTEDYMRLLPFWGIGVSVIWSFSFLKSWERKNASMQFEWNDKIHVKQIEYPNKRFYGEKKINSLTGEVTLFYPSWYRIPKYLCVLLFMLFQTVIMLILVAIWVTIYEILKATYKESHIFSTQWFLILLEGIVFGIFVDVIQWNLVVLNMGKIFTHWENYRTEEQYEKALIRKLFILDFLNYYTWFFSLAFVFVIPGFGDYLTNTLNHFFFTDEMNCCFGPYVDQHGKCIMCPIGPKDATCIECIGFFTFDRHHVDLSAMFVTPIVVTQSLNILIGLVVPVLTRSRRERARAIADTKAQKKVMEAGSMKILGSLDYDKQSHFGNKSSTRYLEYTPSQVELLNKKAREILFESEQDTYDPYNDFHALTVQYGFTVMFSILWPMMPCVCFLINTLKRRADGFRLCKTLKRPIPRKANGIGGWRGIFSAFAYIAVIVNILLVCISTGSLEFFDATCVKDIKHQLEKQGKTMDDFQMGPNFGCMHISVRLLIILALEHVFIGISYVVMTRIERVPQWIRDIMNAREKKFKEMLKNNEHTLFFSSSKGGGSGVVGSKEFSLPENRINISGIRDEAPLPMSTLSPAVPLPAPEFGRTISEDSIPPTSTKNLEHFHDTEDGRTKSREQLARKWSAVEDGM